MRELYVLAVRPKRRPNDIAITDEMDDFIREAAGHEFLISPSWRNPPPISKPVTLPVLVTEPVLTKLLDHDSNSGAPPRIMHYADVDLDEMEEWREIARRQNPLPHGEGVFQWERVTFQVPDDGEDMRWLIGNWTRDPWTLEGDLLMVSPADATVLLMISPRDIFMFIGPDDEDELVGTAVP